MSTSDLNSKPETQMRPSADWSLRASADPYIDRRNEYARLSRRLNNSSASVTGIAGPRGAGKSSLALRVLSDREAPDTYTQLIHAPTGYESREFLASVFQTICQKVVARINNELHQEKGLQERAAAESRRLLTKTVLLLVGCLLPLVGGGVYATLVYAEAARQNEIESWTAIRENLSAVLNGLTDEPNGSSESLANRAGLQLQLDDVNATLIALAEDAGFYGRKPAV